VADELVRITTWTTKKQHVADLSALSQSGQKGSGLSGPALCTSQKAPVIGYDQAALQSQLGRYVATVPTITDLDECKKCLRVLGHRQRALPGAPTSVATISVSAWSPLHQHYAVSDQLRPVEPPKVGLAGETLCSTLAFPLTAYDQAAIDQELACSQAPPVTITDLPECLRCRRRLDRLNPPT
jgi:hypothetical protein